MQIDEIMSGFESYATVDEIEAGSTTMFTAATLPPSQTITTPYVTFDITC